MTMNIRPGDTVQLSDQAESMFGTIQSGYTSKGLKVSCEPLTRTTLGSQTALQSLCQVGKDTPTLPIVKQLVGLAIDARDVYALTYSAPPQSFSTYRPEFRKMADGLTLP
jgi:hypothetical protein